MNYSQMLTQSQNKYIIKDEIDISINTSWKHPFLEYY